MDRVEHLFAAITPGLLILAYGVTKTRCNWTSEALWTAFLLGGLGTVAAIPLELVIRWLADFATLTPMLKAGITAVFVAAIPEESVKYLILIGAAEPHVDARRRQDIIALAIAVSLGFATVENLLFVLAPANWQFVAAKRAMAAVPGHGINGLMMGALLTAARVAPSRRSVWAALALVIPIFMHAAYDFPLFALRAVTAGSAARPWFGALWLAILLVTSVIAIRTCNWILPAAKQADRLSGRDLRVDPPASPIIITGYALLVIILMLTVLTSLSRGASFLATGAALSIVPTALAIDLIWTGFRRRNSAS